MSGRGSIGAMTTARLLRPIAGAALALALAGCLSFGRKVPDVLIGLTAETLAPAGATTPVPIEDALVVVEPGTDRRLATQRVPVQVDDVSVAYLQHAMWVERPALLFRGLLAESIRAKSGKPVFEGVEGSFGGRNFLSGRLLEMGYDAREQAVVVRYDAVRNSADGKISARRFESIVSGIAPKANQVGPALNTAANDVARQVAEWVG
jgi:cholesterol transport system auxiliary component